MMRTTRLSRGGAALTVTVILLATGSLLQRWNAGAAQDSQQPSAAQVVADTAPVNMAADRLVQLTQNPTHDDFPTATVAADGTVWLGYVAYQVGTPVDIQQTDSGNFETLRTRGNGDQLRLMRLADGTWAPPINITGAGLDLWRPAIVAQSDGTVLMIWSQQVEGNWDLYCRTYRAADDMLLPTTRLTTDAGADLHAVAVHEAASAATWIAWQAKRDGNFDIHIARVEEQGLELEQRVSTSQSNDWNPAIAATPGGRIWVAWDTYDKGDYDVYVRSLDQGQLAEPLAIATSSRFEARPSIAIDAQQRLWIAFEDAGVHWGKDFGTRLVGQGVPFYHQRNILVRCVDNGQLKRVVSPPQSQFIYTHFDDTRYKPEFKHRISFPRLGLDGQGNLWLLYRRHPIPETGQGERWVSFARYLDGDRWSPEVHLPQSDNLLDNRPAVVPAGTADLLAIYATDYRDSGSRSAKISNLNAILLRANGVPAPAELVSTGALGNQPLIPLLVPDEAEHIARCREYRIEAGGKQYQLLRGEFHRHTEMSAHRDWDGPMEEVWRYGLDVADMDWIGPGDHDYAVGEEYMWWLTQKQVDLYHDPAQFLPMFTYERSVPFPSGHRNVMFAQRGIRPLPQMAGRQNRLGTPQDGIPDIKNLYQYLRFFGGICSSHTSATNMGTDWREMDVTVEPVVEIFQGHRQNYEEPGALLAAHNAQDSIQGYHPQGFVWEAFKKGIRLGFQSSSDHVSTHISYAFVIAEEPTREGILDAFKKRHSYAANDNIILDVRCGESIMGDELTSTEMPQLEITVIGTSRIARLDIVRQVATQEPQYVYTATPNQGRLQMQWTDREAEAGQTHMYYVRIQQDDARLAWASPLWVTYEPGN